MSLAIGEKRQKYAFGSGAQSGEKQPTKKYSDSHWLNTYNDKQGARAYSLKSRQARRYMVSNYGSSRWLGVCLSGWPECMSVATLFCWLEHV